MTALKHGERFFVGLQEATGWPYKSKQISQMKLLIYILTSEKAAYMSACTAGVSAYN